MLTKFSPTLRKDSFMMIMDNKESKTEDLQEAQASEDCLTSFQGAAGENKLVREKENQNSLNYKSLCKKFFMELWKMSKSKGNNLII